MNWLTAFAAGVVSFLSPCVLPLVPGYVSFMSGLSLEELSAGGTAASRKAGAASICFVLGFALVFTLLGASASAVGGWLDAYRDVLNVVAGVVVILFGLHTMGVFTIKWLYFEKRFQTGGVAPGAAGAFVMGLAFAFGWTPCIGPILAGILALAAREASVSRGMALLFVYSLGLGVPFILTGFGTAAFMRFFARYRKYIRWGEIAAGALLVVIGALILSNRLTMLVNLMPKSLRRFAI
ncbi:MAG: sulfite exporter TauE/SafE family protein [Elusimicrobia bacterium]|nr:sulfite exporter TauE/SafE family protein [Elusimicrobiota bacterium]